MLYSVNKQKLKNHVQLIKVSTYISTSQHPNMSNMYKTQFISFYTMIFSKNSPFMSCSKDFPDNSKIQKNYLFLKFMYLNNDMRIKSKAKVKNSVASSVSNIRRLSACFHPKQKSPTILLLLENEDENLHWRWRHVIVCSKIRNVTEIIAFLSFL